MEDQEVLSTHQMAGFQFQGIRLMSEPLDCLIQNEWGFLPTCFLEMSASHTQPCLHMHQLLLCVWESRG